MRFLRVTMPRGSFPVPIMLNNDSLSQLKQLKQEIEDQKEYAEGVVKGTQKKFGFAVLDDGREIYLSPEEMDKVFPDDRIRVQIFTDSKKKTRAKVEKLLSSPLKTFCGRYEIRGKGHFISPDLPRLNRWIFIPPAARKEAKAGDYILCQISRHPYPQAKPQAKVLKVIGSPDQAGIEADYMISKFGLEQDWPVDWLQSIQETDSSPQREDLSKTAFVTIDAASTQDMDDALYAIPTSDGWKLSVAIADPTALIPAGSPLDLEARRRGTSSYFPGRVVPMLPEELANHRCSLLAGEQRLALVCQMTISAEGNISDYRIIEALICSQAKLSYHDVANFIDGDSDSIANNTIITALAEAATALRKRREADHIIVGDRPEFRLTLNEQGKIEKITAHQKNNAHLLVEECMVAANRCAADMLGTQGLFNSHRGFRPERIRDATKLAEEQLGITDIDLVAPEGYQHIMKAARQHSGELPIGSVLSRLLERGRLSAERAPHYGMGLATYTSFTSPIRRYSDFLVHRLIKAQLHQQPINYPSQNQLDELQQALYSSRQACQQMEQWLKCQFLQDQKGSTASGVISQINSRGFTVRLDESGIEGFVETRTLNKKFSFDPMRLKLNSEDLSLQLDMAVAVIVQEIDSGQRSIRFSLVEAAAK